MSIASELSQLNTNKTNIKAAIVGKNPTVSPTDNLSQWPTSIGSIVELKGETKTITPTTSQQTINPSSGKNGITQITVNPVTSSIDANIQESNIKSGVSILGVNGNVIELNGETKTVTPTTSQQVITPSSGKNAITQVTVSPVTSAIDANIVAGNIKKDVSILGVTGDYEGSGGDGTVQGYTLTLYGVPGGGSEGGRTAPSVVCHLSDGSTTTISGNSSCNDVVYAEVPIGNGDSNLNLYTEFPTGGFYEVRRGSYGNPFYYVHLVADTTISFGYNMCFLKGTLITLVDKSEKLVEDITFEDELLVWDFDNGCLCKAKPIWIKKAQTTDYWFLNKYRSGKILKTTGKSETGWGHRTFDLNKNKFIYTTESVSDNIFTLDGIDTHMSCERIEEPCEYYNIITEKHFNLFANRILASCSLNNLYQIEGMKYVKDNRALRDISDYDNIPQKWFDGLRLAENNTDIVKLNKYVHNLIETNVK